MSAYKLTTKSQAKVLDLKDLYLSDENRRKIDQLIEEFSYIDALKKYDLPVDHKILLHGMTGCGKTATAAAIAKRLNKKIIIINLGNFISSRLGETARNITSVFTSARLENAVLFMDEFDFIGKTRDYDQKDSGEMKRAVNVLLQQIDNLDKKAILICATNYIDIIDSALLRRFQLKLKYEMPSKVQLDRYYDGLLMQYPPEITNLQRKYDISYAEAKDFVIQKIKGNIIRIEKKKKQLLFSYDNVDAANYPIEKHQETLTGYKLAEQLKTEVDRQVFIATKTDNQEDIIQGKVLAITMAKLLEMDQLKLENYKRILVNLQSGMEAWAYVKK